MRECEIVKKYTRIEIGSITPDLHNVELKGRGVSKRTCICRWFSAGRFQHLTAGVSSAMMGNCKGLSSKMAFQAAALVLLLASQATLGQDLPYSRRVQDPVSNFLSELGGLFLDADRAIAVQSAPKVRFEDSLAGSLLRPRREQFARAQDTYRGVQNQLGTLIARALVSPGAVQPFSLFPPSPQDQLLATVDRILAGTRRAGDLLLTPMDGGQQGLERRQGEASSSPAETRFDQYLRQLLRDHGRWVMANPLIQGLRTTTQSTTLGTGAPEASSSSGQPVTDDGSPANAAFYDVGPVTEEVKVVLQGGEKDTLLLAFTEDGVPLKLRLGPEVQNPISYLHRILKAAAVTLKVPVASSEDLEPVGKEVLVLGSDSGQVSRAVYLNLSNPPELRSLLRTLLRTKPLKDEQ